MRKKIYFLSSTFSEEKNYQLISTPEVCIQIGVLLFGLIGNSLIIIVTIINKKLHSLRAGLVCILAFNDGVQCIYQVCITFYIKLYR